MATIPAGASVEFIPEEQAKLTFPPPSSSALLVAIHDDALKAPYSIHTQLVATHRSAVIWAGGVGEDLVLRSQVVEPTPRPLLAARLLIGSHLWSTVKPGSLTLPGATRPLSTIYDGDNRPWIVIGELVNGLLLAVPLNEPPEWPQRRQWYTPVLKEEALVFPGSKDSLVELAHVWSIPPGAAVGVLSRNGQDQLKRAIRAYFPFD